MGRFPIANAHPLEGEKVAGIRICREIWSGRLARRQLLIAVNIPVQDGCLRASVSMINIMTITSWGKSLFHLTA